MDLRPPSPYHDLWAVIIQCRRTDGTQNRETFRPIVISPLESQYHVDDPPCVIPAMIGIPIWMRRHNWQRYQSYDSRVHVWTPPPNVENRPAGWLDFNVNNDFDDVRISNIHIGDTLVARKDGKELTVPHLLMLCEFCRYIQTEVKWLAPAKDEDDDEEDDYNKPGIRNPARPLAAETPASKAGGKAEKRVVKLVSKKKFEEWCRRYRENKANTTGDERWRDYVLPTEI